MKNIVKIISLFVGIILFMVIIDLIFIFTLNRPLFAIKDKSGYVYRGIFYDTYNCPEYSSSQIKSKGLRLACSQRIEESEYVITEVDNVSISILDITSKGATVKIKDTNKNPYVYGEWYKIEKNIDGKWYLLDVINKDYVFNEIGYLPDKNNEVKFYIDWSLLYGELSEGNYRVLKQVNNQYISVEFNITTINDDKLIEVVKPEYYNYIKFNKYLEIDNRTIYLSGNIEEVYYKNYKLKDYISKTWQTSDDSISSLTNEMELIGILKDGGTKIYKSNEYDITIIRCNTLSLNRDIFIGDYLMNFDSESMCK